MGKLWRQVCDAYLGTGGPVRWIARSTLDSILTIFGRGREHNHQSVFAHVPTFTEVLS